MFACGLVGLFVALLFTILFAFVWVFCLGSFLVLDCAYVVVLV